MPNAPLALLASVARKVSADTGVRAVARRAPVSWRDDPDGTPYVVVTQVSPLSPSLRGDGDTLREGLSIQASLWETEDNTDDDRLRSIVGALDGTWLDVDARGTVTETLLVPDESTSAVHHAITVRYLVSR